MTSHIELATLAELVDGSMPTEASVNARRHLVTCRSCMAAYADAVRYRAAWLADSEAFDVPDDALRLASRHGPPGASPARRHLPGIVSRVLRIAAAMVVVAGASVFWLASRTPSLDFELPPAVRQAAEVSSARGLVLPGATVSADRAQDELRSGGFVSSPGLDREVGTLLEEYENAPSPERGARVLAGLLATGEIHAARAYAGECLNRFPRHVALLVFASDASFRANDLAEAEQRLRRAARLAPGDPVVALDLALVLRQLDREDEARPLLLRVSESRVPSLAARATRELSHTRRPPTGG